MARNTQGELFGEDLFRSIFEGHHAIMLLIDSVSGRILNANAAAERFYGYSIEKLRGMRVSDINTLPPEEISDTLRDVLRGVRDFFVFSHRLANGETRTVEVRSSPFFYQGRQILFSIVHDITERKKTEEELRLSRQRLSLHVEQTPLAVIEFDIEGRIRGWNPAAEKIFGFTREEVVGQHWTFIVPEAVWDRLEGVWEELVTRRGGTRSTNKNRTRDGRAIICEWFSTPLVDQDGKAIGVASLVMDITERKQAEREREQYFNFFQNSSDIMVIADPNGSFKKTNPACTVTLGYSEAELVSKPFVEFVHPDDRQSTIDETIRQLQRGFSLNFENRYLCKDGSVRWLSWRSTYDKDEGLTYATARDITERKQAEEALRESEQKYRKLHESMRDGFVYVDMEGRIREYNETYREMLGYSPEELVSLTYFDITPERWHAFEQRIVEEQLLQTGYSEVYEKEYRRKDGTIFPVELRTFLIKTGEGQNEGMWAIVRDVTERKKTEDALQKSEAFIKNILKTVDEGFIVVDREYKILSANKAFCDTASMNEELVLGRPCHEVSHHAEKLCFETGEDCPVRKVFEAGEASVALHTHTRHDGSRRHVEIKAFPVRDTAGNVVSAIETINDITERKHLEEQLRHAQKLESLGTLAGGVAHDFNNILNVIVGYGGMMEMRIPKDDPNTTYLKEILAAAERATQLTQALLIFSRKQSTVMKPVSINILIDGIRKMMLRLIGEDIEIVISPARENMMVMGDYGQLEQVLMNFVTNARDAMPDGGTLSIETRPHTIDSEFIHMHGFGKPGKYSLISVSDTGEGMDEKTRERIFEPFFTTKGVGKGTGLGLSIVYGIVKQHHGYINCYSEPARGTTFKVYLPVIREELLELEEADKREIIGGNETILVADDDESIRRLTKELLEHFGYTVIDALDGEDALNKFIEQKERIDLVLLDVIMPRKSGREAFEVIRSIKPGVKVLFISGYTEDIIQRKRIIEDELPLLQKPAKPKELLARIRETLDAKSD